MSRAAVSASAYDPIHVLWTSGWDSTFILLDALLWEGCPVVPHYVVDPDRPSTERELGTMDAIAAALVAHDPAAAACLAELRVVPKEAIAPEPQVDAWYETLQARVHVAPQYAWLSRYARTCEAPLALGIIRRSGGLRDVIGPELEVGPDGVRRLKAELSDEAFELFRPFRYPIIERSKLEMRDLALERGYLPLLERSWFCHEPRRDGSPCGWCPPCHDALHQGMGWRLSAGARWRGRIMDIAPGAFLEHVARKVLRTLVP